MKICIGVVSYNFSKYIGECLDSLLKQTLVPTNIIIGDDCSTDGSFEIIQQYQKKYPNIINAYQTPSNQGAFCNGTMIGRLLDGDYCSMVDGDDRWHPQKIEKEVAALKRYNADIAFSDVNITDNNGVIIGEWTKLNDIPICGDLFIPILGKRVFNNCGSVFRNELWTRRAFEEEGHGDNTLSNYWDWDRKIRLSQKYKIAFSGDKLVDYRQHPGGISKTFGGVNLFAAHLQVYEKHLPTLAKYPLSQQIRAMLSFETRVGYDRNNMNIVDFTKYSLCAIHDRLENIYIQLNTRERVDLLQEYSSEICKLITGATQEIISSSQAPTTFIEQNVFLRDINNYLPEIGNSISVAVQKIISSFQTPNTITECNLITGDTKKHILDKLAAMFRKFVA